MRKITLLVAGLLLFSNITIASEKNVFIKNEEGYRFSLDYRNADPIAFKERGIEFFVFLDGQFDFNTQPTTGPTRYRTENSNRTYGAPGVRNVNLSNMYYGPNARVRIEHDTNGRVRRIGNVFINYDTFGRVKRIGTVYMQYNSFALKQLGNMRIFYNRRGQIKTITGFVNQSNYGNGFTFNGNQNNGNSYGNGNNPSYGSNFDDDFYYYKKDGNKVKMEEADILEIKKQEGFRKK